MGSPLAPTCAGFFMDNFESKTISKLRRKGVKVWFRYVDDTFVVLRGKDYAEEVLSFLNSQHNNIKFTVEHEKDNSIPFLDTKVKRKSDLKLFTTLYHKKTFTGTYLNWNSLTDRKYKIGLIYCLLDRIWKIVSEQRDRDLEVSKLKAILAKNDYPTKIIEAEITKFINNRINSTNGNKSTPSDTETVGKVVKFIVLPYVNDKVIEYGKRLKIFIEKNFSNLELKVVFTAPMEMRNLFKFKDRITDKYKQSLVLYRINCAECDHFYIGKTERIMGNRFKEHIKTPTTKTPNENAPYKHSSIYSHKIDYEGIVLIDRADSDFKLRIKETLHIIEKKPQMNTLCKSDHDLKTLIF